MLGKAYFMFPQPLLTIFKNNTDSDKTTNKERDLVSCKISLQGDRLKILLLANQGIVKTHNLHFESCSNTSANYTKSTMSGKLVTDWLNFFATKLDQIKMYCTENRIVLSSKQVPTINSSANADRALYSELLLHPDNFVDYTLEKEDSVNLVFALKDFRTVLAASADLGVYVNAFLPSVGPVIFTIEQAPLFSIEYVLSTQLAQQSEPTASNVMPTTSQRLSKPTIVNHRLFTQPLMPSTQELEQESVEFKPKTVQLTTQVTENNFEEHTSQDKQILFQNADYNNEKYFELPGIQSNIENPQDEDEDEIPLYRTNNQRMEEIVPGPSSAMEIDPLADKVILHQDMDMVLYDDLSFNNENFEDDDDMIWDNENDDDPEAIQGTPPRTRKFLGLF
ncbi:cell cycle checkpoint control protein rad9a, partial [Nowakowskiella sp. JEL0078]